MNLRLLVVVYATGIGATADHTQPYIAYFLYFFLVGSLDRQGHVLHGSGNGTSEMRPISYLILLQRRYSFERPSISIVKFYMGIKDGKLQNLGNLYLQLMDVGVDGSYELYFSLVVCYGDPNADRPIVSFLH